MTTLRGPLRSAIEPVSEIDTTVASQSSLATLQTLIFTVILPVPSLYTVRLCLTVSSEQTHGLFQHHFLNKTLTLCSAKFVFRILLRVWISMIIQEKYRGFQCSRRPTARSRQSAANQNRVFDVISKCIVGKTTDFSDLKTNTSH